MPDGWTHNPPIVRANRAPEQTFCAVRLANSYQIDRHSYSAICRISPHTVQGIRPGWSGSSRAASDSWAGVSVRNRRVLGRVHLASGTAGRLGSLLRPELRWVRCRVADTVAMIAPGIDTFQDHQALSLGG
jgi:hypothetical protein